VFQACVLELDLRWFVVLPRDRRWLMEDRRSV
jgi:hypothetical protein